MSTANFTETENFPVDVIVRAFESEPVALRAVGRMNDKAIEIAGHDPAKTIGFHNADVFRFDAELFRQLRSAFEKRKADQMHKLWDKAVRLVS